MWTYLFSFKNNFFYSNEITHQRRMAALSHKNYCRVISGIFLRVKPSAGDIHAFLCNMRRTHDIIIFWNREFGQLSCFRSGSSSSRDLLQPWGIHKNKCCSITIRQSDLMNEWIKFEDIDKLFIEYSVRFERGEVLRNIDYICDISIEEWIFFLTLNMLRISLMCRWG